MNKKVILAIVALVVVGGVAVLYFATRPNASAPGNTNTNSAAEVGSILYTDSGFQPSTLKVKANTMVHVVNQSSMSLQFSSDDHPTHLKDPELNMEAIQPGKEAMLKVTKTGTWGYHNHLKPTDRGTIEVE